MNAKAIWRRMSFWFIRNVGAFESSTKFAVFHSVINWRQQNYRYSAPLNSRESRIVPLENVKFRHYAPKRAGKTRLYFDPTIGTIVLQKTTEKKNNNQTNTLQKRYLKNPNVSPSKYKLSKIVKQKKPYVKSPLRI